MNGEDEYEWGGCVWGEDVCEWGGCVSVEDECVSKDVCGG